jgi:hypothetical protein
MTTVPIAAIIIRRSMAEARSALPDAPVVPDAPVRRTPRARRPRIALAHLLERAAHAVAPAPPGCTPTA